MSYNSDLSITVPVKVVWVPKNSNTPLILSRNVYKKGTFKWSLIGSGPIGAERVKRMMAAVALAASHPSSSTDMNVLWSTSLSVNSLAPDEGVS